MEKFKDIKKWRMTADGRVCRFGTRWGEYSAEDNSDEKNILQSIV